MCDHICRLCLCADIDVIIDIEIKKLKERLKDLNYELKLTKKAKNYIAKKGFDENFGARPLKRAIQKYIEDPFAEEIIQGKVGEGDQINARNIFVDIF